jgi:uncharacterized protein (TIGR00369 family)
MTEDVQDLTPLVHEQMPLARSLGIRVAGGPDAVEATLDYSPELCTAGGILHGGAIMALADSAGAVCAYLNLPPGAGTATIESKTNFLAAVREGSIVARARPLHEGKTTIVVETDVHDASGRLVARTMQTQAIVGP